MFHFRRLAGAVIAVLLAGPLASSYGATSGPPYEINAILSLTGPGAFLGKNEATAFQFVEDNVNKSGGISGRPIKFVVQDDQSSPQTAVQLLNNIMAKNVPIVLGSSLSGACNAMAAIAQNGPVVYCLAAGVHPPKGSYEFTYGVSSIDSMATDIRYFRNRGLTKVALMTTTDATGEDAAHNIPKVLAMPENRAITLVANEYYNPSDVSVSAQIARIKASGAQFLVVWAVGAPFGTLLRGAADAGLEMPIATTAGNLIYSEMKQFAPIMPKELYFSGLACVAYDALPRGALKSAVGAFVDSFKAHGYDHPDLANAIGWDPPLIAVSALKKLGLNATPAAIREYIAGVHDWAGANGVYDFRDGSQRGLAGQSHSIVVRWDQDKDTWVAVSGFGGVSKVGLAR